jgi:hypothetical protein
LDDLALRGDVIDHTDHHAAGWQWHTPRGVLFGVSRWHCFMSVHVGLWSYEMHINNASRDWQGQIDLLLGYVAGHWWFGPWVYPRRFLS